MKLGIGTKVNVLIVAALLLVGGFSVFLSSRALDEEGRKAVNDYKNSVMAEKKQNIKGMVDAVYTIAKSALDESKDKNKIREEFGSRVQAAVNQAFSVLQSAYENEACGDMAARKAAAIALIKKMRWGKDNKGYFWIQNTDLKMVMHPIKPSFDGKDLSNFKDPDGKYFFKAFSDVAKEKGAGFVSYKWPKPGFDKPVDKISYVKLFKPWGWVIGGGIYLESTEKELQKKVLKTISAIRFGKDKAGYIFIYNSKGICILHSAKPALNGKNMYDVKDKKGNYVIRDLIAAADSSSKGGFFQYFWPKPGSDTPIAKLSFARRLKGWDWNIGTGIYTDDVKLALAKKSAQIKKRISSEIFKTILIIACIFLLALAAAYFIVGKGVVGPIRRMITMLKDIAEGEGDLTKRIEDNSGDETQELAEWFNKFIDNLQEIIKKVKLNADKLTDSSKNLAVISDEMNNGAEGVADRANTVSSASEEMNANLNSMAAAMEQAATNINMVASAAEEMSATIGEIAKNTEHARSISDNAVGKVDKASNQVNDLGNAAREIGQVVESITDISEQVNLLALNATIEAARAGKAGKGFAVVANEIKELASQTADATQEIKKRVNGIQNSTENTVNEIAGISEVVEETKDIVSTVAAAVEEQSVATREIADNVGQASQGIGEINENIAQGSIASEEVSKEIAEVTHASNEIANSSSQVKINAQDTSGLAENLAEMVGKFKV